MKYPPALFDDSDPAYAPGLNVAKGLCYWKAPKTYRAKGYEPASVRLPGKAGDGADRERAAECRRLTIAMLASEDSRLLPPPKTWGDALTRYQMDRESPYAATRHSTREDYDYRIAKWRAIIGHMRLDQLGFMELKAIHLSMTEKGRSVAYIHRLFNGLRGVASYTAVAFEDPGAMRTRAALGQMKVANPPRRQVAATREQVRAVMEEAFFRHMPGFALGLAFQWTYALRGVDVFGQWEPAKAGQGGIVYRGQRWVDGLTWDMFAPDLSTFTKVISKTRKSLPEPMTFAVTAPIRQLLSETPAAKRIGPVVVASTHPHMPYAEQSRSRAWRRIARDVGIPDEVCLMDTRSGALTEAGALSGGDVLMVRDAAGHLNTATTNGYLRARDANAEKVVRLRFGNEA